MSGIHGHGNENVNIAKFPFIYFLHQEQWQLENLVISRMVIMSKEFRVDLYTMLCLCNEYIIMYGH